MAEKKLATLYVDIKARTGKLEKDLNKLKSKTAKTTKEMTSGFSKFGKFLAGGAIVAGATLVAKKLLNLGLAAKNAARDAEETRSKFEQVFISIKTKAFDAANAFATSFKLAKSTAYELLGATGDLLVGFGFTEEAALDLSLQVNSLAQDLASFQNIDTKRASQSLTKALTGETESLKTLGIVVRQGTKEFIANAAAIQKAQGVTEQQAKSIEILRIATVQSGKAIGDFARTQDSLANQEKILSEKFKELSEQVGNALIPIFKDVTSVAVEFLQSLTETELEATIRQLQDLGIAAEQLKSLQDINISIKVQENLSDVLEDLENIRDLAKDTGIFGSGFDFSAGSFMPIPLPQIAESKADLDNLRKILLAATDASIPLVNRFDIINDGIKQLSERADELNKALVEAYIKGEDTDELKSKINNLNSQLKILGITSASLDKQFSFQNTLKKVKSVAEQWAGYTKFIIDSNEQLKLGEQLLDGYEKQLKKIEDAGGTKGNAVYDDALARLEAQKSINLNIGTDDIKNANLSLIKLENILKTLQDKRVNLPADVSDADLKKINDDIALVIKKIEKSKIKLGIIVPEDNKEAISSYVEDLLEQEGNLKTKIDSLTEALRNENTTVTQQVILYRELVRLKTLLGILTDTPEPEIPISDKLEGDDEILPDVPVPDFEDATSSAGELENKFTSMLNTTFTIASVFDLAAETFGAKLLKTLDDALSIASSILGIISAFGGNAAGGIFGLIGGLFGHQGGTFQNGRKIASFAGGGDFTVPSGYPNDSFQMRVESGERVSVTPSNKAGNTDKLLGELIGSVKAMNINLINKNLSVTVPVNIDGRSLVKEVTKPIENKLTRGGIDVTEL